MIKLFILLKEKVIKLDVEVFKSDGNVMSAIFVWFSDTSVSDIYYIILLKTRVIKR